MTDKAEIKTILFDLDGTLVDTAPDLSETLNRLLIKHNKPARSHESIRPHVSHGAAAMLNFAFGITEDETGFASLREEFLNIYENDLCHQSQLFEGMGEVLEYIENRNMSWGVITNKPAFLTQPLMQALSLDNRSACTISGDTLPQRKPDPAPMLHAAELTGCQAGECVYVGDAERDIEAGNRAGMHTLVALYGYLEKDDNPDHWQADGSINKPTELIEWLEAKRIYV